MRKTRSPDKTEFISSYLPTSRKKKLKQIQDSGLKSLDILWSNIELHFLAILESQKIMYVKSKNEMIKELKKTKIQKETQEDKEGNEVQVEVYREEEFEFQFSWDRQATYLESQSKAMQTVTNMIKDYEELLHKDWKLASEEQKHRVERLKLQVLNLEIEYNKNTLDKNKNYNPYAGLNTEELKKLISDG